MDSAPPKTCCICGRVLPNGYAVAGTCISENGCREAFCSYHWHVGNHLCRQHGWREPGTRGGGGTGVAGEEASAGDIVLAPVEAPVPESPTGGAVGDGGHAAQGVFAKIGAGIAAFARKVSGVRSPEEMEASCEAALASSRARREPLLGRHEELFRDISAKKKAWQAAPAVRKHLLEMELRTLLAEYRGVERQLSALFENERTLVTVLAGLREVSAYGMRKVSGPQIDGLSEKLEDATGEAEALADAVDALGKAGKRREVSGETESLEEALAGFGDGMADERGQPSARTVCEPSGREGETSGVRQAVASVDVRPPDVPEADT